MQTFHEVIVTLGYIMLFLLGIIILGFFAGLIVFNFKKEKPKDINVTNDTELIKDDDNQIFMNP